MLRASLARRFICVLCGSQASESGNKATTRRFRVHVQLYLTPWVPKFMKIQGNGKSFQRRVQIVLNLHDARRRGVERCTHLNPTNLRNILAGPASTKAATTRRRTARLKYREAQRGSSRLLLAAHCHFES